MATETTKTTPKWKVWVVGILIVLCGAGGGGIGGCAVKILTGGNPADAVTQGATDAKQGYDVIKTGELPSQ